MLLGDLVQEGAVCSIGACFESFLELGTLFKLRNNSGRAKTAQSASSGKGCRLGREKKSRREVSGVRRNETPIRRDFRQISLLDFKEVLDNLYQLA